MPDEIDDDRKSESLGEKASPKAEEQKSEQLKGDDSNLSTLETADIKKPTLAASPVSRALLLLNTAVFGILVYRSGVSSMLIPSVSTLLAWGANSASATIGNAEYWRLFTNIFVHAGFMHLVLNMYALTLIAPIVERAFGGSKLVVLYLVAGVFGSLCSSYFDIQGISVGASGAILGLFGAMVSFIARFPNPKIPFALKNYLLMLAVMVVSTALVGFTFQGIDNAAHFGGLVGGFAAGWAVRPNVLGNRGWRGAEIVRALVLVLALVLSGSFVIKSLINNPAVKAESLTLRAAGLMKEEHYGEACKLLDEALLLAPDSYTARCKHALACVSANRQADALADAQKVLQLRPKEIQSHVLQAAIFQKVGRYKDSLTELDQCQAMGGKEPVLNNDRAWSEAALGQYGEAMADIQRALEKKQDSSFYDTLGAVYMCMQKYQDALTALNRAIDMDKDNGAAYFHRAFVHYMLNQRIAAKSDTDNSHRLKYKPENWELEVISNLESTRKH